MTVKMVIYIDHLRKTVSILKCFDHPLPITHHVLGQKTPSVEKNVPEVGLQGRDPVAERTELQSHGTGLVGEEICEEETNDILERKMIRGWPGEMSSLSTL